MEQKAQELQFEREHLRTTIQSVEAAIEQLKEKRSKRSTETFEARKSLNFTELNQQYDLMTSSAVFDAADAEKITRYERAKSKPYFGHIDFLPERAETAQTYYIGKTGIEDRTGQIVLDWRAPVSNVYYANGIGQVSYQAPGGEIKGDLRLKRQFVIEDGSLEFMTDADVAANDDFLQLALGDSKDNRLKDIVSTIQAEQNEIIRAPLDVPLVVQGAAGSGKTTIALHRIAYLIYTYQKNFRPKDFLIIAPNTIFLDYISGVLPELGVDKIRQSTFEQLAARVITDPYQLSDPNEKLAALISPERSEQEKQQIREISRFKGSLEFLSLLHRYLSELTGIDDLDDFTLHGKTVFTAEEIRTQLERNRKLSWQERVKQLKNYLSVSAKRLCGKIEEEITTPYDEELENIRCKMSPSPERRAKSLALIDARDQELSAFREEYKSAVTKYMKRFPKMGALKCYRALLTNTQRLLAETSLSEDCAAYLAAQTKKLQKAGLLEIEDLAPLMLLSQRINGADDEFPARFVVIDEAQDFSELQLAVLRELLGTSRFSIFGDLAQGIHGHRGIQNWAGVCEQVLNPGCEYRTLEQSYRTTIEIMSFANEVLRMGSQAGIPKAKPVVRHGALPSVRTFDDPHALFSSVVTRVREHQKDGRASIAIVTKTDAESERIYGVLKQTLPELQLLCGKDTVYNGGLMVMPAYLSKGLEFDAVIVVGAGDDYTQDDLDVKLLYVAITRALHAMDVFRLRDKMHILDACDPKTYTI